MIAATGRDTCATGLVPTPAKPLPPIPELEQECRSYARYLAGQHPSRYLIEKYQDFHQKIGFAGENDRFDDFLISVSAQGPIRARLADTYASFWRKNSALRKKIVLTLALLECAPPTFEALDRVPAGGCTGAVLRLGLGAAGYGFTLLIATVLFTPVRLWMGAGER
jgi:hypothetical protein